jgi:hypothetical protein
MRAATMWFGLLALASCGVEGPPVPPSSVGGEAPKAEITTTVPAAEMAPMAPAAVPSVQTGA